MDDSKSLVKLSSKFGARLGSVGRLLKLAGELGLDVIGVSFHVGSGCTGSLPFKQGIADARHVFDLAVSHHHCVNCIKVFNKILRLSAKVPTANILN